MKRRSRCVAVLGLLAAAGCSGDAATDRAGTGGDAGATGSSYEFEVVDQTCREWCVNLDHGFSCHPGPPDSVRECHEACLADYQRHRESLCGDPWVDILRCQLAVDCADSLGDCQPHFDALGACNVLAADRAFCQSSCPWLDLDECTEDTAPCHGHLHCESACPTQDRGECVGQYLSTGTCAYEEATHACRRYCSNQALGHCVEQWRETGRCQFDDGRAACNAICPPVGVLLSYCAEYWDSHGICPDGPPQCLPQSRSCEDSPIGLHVPCCTPSLPVQVNACTGNESLTNPATCTVTGRSVTHRLLLMEVADSCHTGFDLDECDGVSCSPGGLAPSEGTSAIDNAFSGLQRVFDDVGGNLRGINQAFSDALCGMEESPTTGVCEVFGPPLVITFEIDSNADESCANVMVTSVGVCDAASTNPGEPCTDEGACANGSCLGGGVSEVILNLGAPFGPDGAVCMSGSLGAIPFLLGSISGTFGNSVIRASLSDAGFTDGLMGTTLQEDIAGQLAELLLPGASVVIAQVLDIRQDSVSDTTVECDAISATFEVSGAAVAP